MRALAQAKFSRGSVQINLEIERETGAETVRVNEAALERILTVAKAVRKKHRLPAPTVEGLLALRGVLEIGAEEVDAKDAAARKAGMLKSLAKAFDSLSESRRGEGRKLRPVLEAQIERIEQLTRAARDSPARSPDLVKARLKEQVARLLETGNSFDPDRLHQEAVLLATRSDIQEEIDRLTGPCRGGARPSVGSRAGGPKARLPRPGVQSRGQYPVLEGAGQDAHRNRPEPQGRDRSDARAGAEH